jgi:hypothetical protein
MFEAREARVKQEAHQWEAACNKPAAAAAASPDDPSDPEELELVDPADYDLPDYRDP